MTIEMVSVVLATASRICSAETFATGNIPYRRHIEPSLPHNVGVRTLEQLRHGMIRLKFAVRSPSSNKQVSILCNNVINMLNYAALSL